MAVLTITAVRPTENTDFELVPYGTTIAAGQTLYRHTDGEHLLADADLSASTKSVAGIALTPGVDGGQGIIATSGNIILVGATMTAGVTYFQGPVAGQIATFDELLTGDYVTRIGTAKSATEMILSIEDTGVQIP